MNLDCLIISSAEHDVDKRLVVSDVISKNCCKRQILPYIDGNYYFYPQFLSLIKDNSKNYFDLNEVMPLDIMRLLSFLKKNNVNVASISFSECDKLEFYLSQMPTVIVINLENSNHALAYRNIVKYIRSRLSNAKIIASGKYIYNKQATSKNIDWKTLKETIGADVYVTNDLAYEVLKNLKSNVGEKRDNFNIEYIKNYIDLNYLKEKKLNSQLVYYSTSIGCPCCCSFCNYPIKNNAFQFLDMEIIEKQLDLFQKQGIENIVFMDDTINIPTYRFRDFLKLLISKKYKFQWYCYFRLKECDEETIKLMYESGCKGVFVGIESTDDNVLKNMNKNALLTDYFKALNLLKKYNISTMAFFLVGFPGETKDTVRKTSNFIEQEGLIDYYTANLWYADPSTPIYKEKREFGIKGQDFLWSHNTMNSLTASNMVDTMVLTVRNSIWVPNENFGFQGIPYLISKGYSKDTVDNILRQCQTLLKCSLTGRTSNYLDVINNLKILL